MRVAFVVNPRSGARRKGGAPLEERLRRAALRHGLEAELVLTRARGHAEELARAAAAAGFPVVAAVGGDGTANEVARGLAGSAAALALVPRGSGNGLARDLGVSLDLERAVAQIARGRPRRIDLGEVSGHPFAMTVGFGIDAHVAHRFDAAAGGRRGALPYFSLALAAYFRYRPPRLRLVAPGLEREVAPLLLVAANMRQYGAGAVIAPTALPDDGLLDLVYVPPLRPLRALYYAGKLFSASIDLAPGVEIARLAELRVVGEGPLEAQLDGEPVTLPPEVVVRCRPGALAVWL